MIAAPSTGAAACAILLSLINDDDAVALVQTLEPDDVQALCKAMEDLPRVGEADIEAALAVFLDKARAANPVALGGQTALRHVLERSLGADRARVALSKGTQATPHPLIAKLKWLEVDDLVDLIDDEHPQVGATILSHLDPDKAAQVLVQVGEPRRADLLLRTALLGSIDDAALDELEIAIGSRQQATTAPVLVGGAEPVAAILNRLDRGVADRELKTIARFDKGLAASIDALRVVFDDVLALSDKALGVVVRGADQQVLVRVLKGLDSAVGDRLLAGLSARAAETLRDELAELAPLSRAEIDEAKAALVGLARRLADAGTITLNVGQPDLV